MGVYIKGMKKPNSCEKCRFKYREDEVVGIDFGARCIFSNHFILSIEMDKDCPLVEVPEPHGRLIDEDAYEQTMREWHCEECKAKKRDYNGVRCRACWVDDAIDSVSMTLAVIEAEGK